MNPASRLEPRHRKVGRLILQRLTYDEIAAALGLSVHTVKQYAHQLYVQSKTNCCREFRAWAQEHPDALRDDL